MFSQSIMFVTETYAKYGTRYSIMDHVKFVEYSL